MRLSRSFNFSFVLFLFWEHNVAKWQFDKKEQKAKTKNKNVMTHYFILIILKIKIS